MVAGIGGAQAADGDRLLAQWIQVQEAAAEAGSELLGRCLFELAGEQHVGKDPAGCAASGRSAHPSHAVRTAPAGPVREKLTPRS